MSGAVRLECGDCLEVMPRLFAEGLRADSAVFDPPYHLASIVDRLGNPDAAPIQSGATGVYARSSSGFMGQKWDGGDVAFRAETWRMIFDLLRPGAHAIAFGHVRTYHRMACAGDLVGIPHDAIYKLFRGWSYTHVYDHEHHVALTESVEARRALPTDFALMPVQSWHPEVWTDVARMLGANTMQSAKGREQHLCPLPFDIVDRSILNWSNPGELVFDPFGGLMTVPLRAVKHGRRGAGVELNPGYFADGVKLLREQDAGRATPGLFDLLETMGEAA